MRRASRWLSSEYPAIAPRGQTPLVRVPARRKNLSLIPAITYQGTVRFMIYAGALNARLLITFVQRLTRDARFATSAIIRSATLPQRLQMQSDRVDI